VAEHDSDNGGLRGLLRRLFSGGGGPGGLSRVRRALLDFDARLDSTLFHSGRWLSDSYERYSAFMDKFHVSGWPRLGVEILSEGASVGAAGLMLMLALAIPAMEETSDDDWLKKSELAVTFLDRYGNPIGSRGIKHDDSLKLEDFPDHLIKATLATEDRRFYDHFGIDVPGTLRALVANTRAGGVVQGGSTITQQLAKNLFLSNERTIERKLREAFLALWLEAHLSKNEILKLYLDRAYLGGGAYGVEAAAHFYFNKSARDVNLAEAAMLAGMFKAPTKFAPHANLPAARARANVVLDNLVESGMMTEGQVFGARRNPATPVDRRDEHSPDYYLDWAFDEMRKLVDTFPHHLKERVFVVRTALDLNLQNAAELAVQNSLRQYGRDYHASQAAVVLADLDGAVRAMVGGTDYAKSQFNRATSTSPGRQPGSSFKPYVYATALANGFKPSSIVVDQPICLGNWCPQNYGRSYAGPVTLTQALTNSINTVAVQLSVRLGDGNAKAGRAKIIATARAMGIKTALPDSSSLPIGAAEVDVLGHTVAFATFPNLGKAVTPHAILEVRTGDGEVVWRFDRDGPKPVQVLSPRVASDMNMMLNSVVEHGTGKRAILDGVRVAGKTGTTNSYRDAWFVGFTGNFVCGVWIGNDDNSPTNRMTGGSLPAMTWHQIMAYAHTGIELKNIPGVTPNPAPGTMPVQAALSGSGARPVDVAPRPPVLTRRAGEILVRIERLMEDASRALVAAGEPVPADPDQPIVGRGSGLAATSDGRTPTGN
jgi:penicillin-binding protein 1A